MKASIRNIKLPEAKRLTHTIKDNHFAGEGINTHEVRLPTRKIEGIPPSKEAMENANKVKVERAKKKHEIVLRMALEGKRDQEISSATGYTEKTIHSLIRNMRRQGIDIPDRKRGREKNAEKDKKESG